MKETPNAGLRFLVVLAAFMSLSCSGPADPQALNGTISISGSSTIMPLMREVAEMMRNVHPGLSFSFQPAGTFVGQRRLASGSVDMACSDVAMGEQYFSANLQEVIFAAAPIHIIAHPGVSISSLSEEQVTAVLTGQIRNWNQLGGPDLPLQLVRRLQFSGTRFVVDAFFLGGESPAERVLPAASGGEVVEMVAATPGALGFAGGGTLEDAGVATLALNGARPTAENMQDGGYPLVSRSRIIFSGDPSPRVAEFALFITSSQFADRVAEMGFLPLAGQTDTALPTSAAAPSPSAPTNPWESLGLALAGIGLFLAGVRFVSGSLEKMTSWRLRQVFARWTKNPVLGAVWGMLCGAISQSGTSSGFLLVGFVASGMIPLRTATFILSWAEVGTALLVFLAAANIKLFILYLLALSGIAYSVDKRRKYDALLLACLGLGLLLFGFDLLKTTAVGMTDMVWIQQLMALSESSLLLMFLMGAGLRLLTQSSSVVTILCIPLMNAGMIGLPHSVAMVCGTSAGAALAGWLLSGELRGLNRQLILSKGISDALSSLLLLVLLFMEDSRGEAYLIMGLNHTAATATGRLAVMYLLAKLVPTLLSQVLGQPIRALAAHWSPKTPEEEMARRRYLHDHALDNPAAAIDLAARESDRVFLRLPRYLDVIRQEEAAAEAEVSRAVPCDPPGHLDASVLEAGSDNGSPVMTAENIHGASVALGAEVTAVIAELFTLDVGYENSERLLHTQNKHLTVMELAETVRDLVAALESSGETSGLEPVCVAMGEGLHAMLTLATDMVTSGDDEDRQMLLQLSADNGALMEELRNTYLQGEERLAPEARPALLQLTNQYQRAVWLLHRWASIL